MLTRCTKLTQLEATWDLCRAQGAQGLGFVCEFVGSIADDPMTKNIQNSTGCNDTTIRESLSVPSISVISNVDNIRRQGEEMVADEVKKGSCPLRLVNQAKSEEQKYIEKMRVFEDGPPLHPSPGWCFPVRILPGLDRRWHLFKQRAAHRIWGGAV